MYIICSDGVLKFKSYAALRSSFILFIIITINSMTSPLDLVRSTTEWVVSQAQEVSIDDDAIEREVAKLLARPSLKNRWGDYPTHYYKEGSDLMAQYVLVMDSLNFCFWPNKSIEYEHLAGPLRDVLLKDEHAFDGERLANLTKEELTKWLGPEFPLMDERLRLLRETGTALATHFNGRASELIKRANGSAAKLVELVTSYIPGFRDHCVYKGRQVFLYKRVQIFVGDVWGAYEGKGLGKFDDIDQLTMFPDYRVPQMLEYNGILKYAPALAKDLAAHVEVIAGTQREIEIRSASVVAIERMRARMRAQGCAIHSIELDWLMWNEAEADLDKMPPFHRCLTIYY